MTLIGYSTETKQVSYLDKRFDVYERILETFGKVTVQNKITQSTSEISIGISVIGAKCMIRRFQILFPPWIRVIGAKNDTDNSLITTTDILLSNYKGEAKVRRSEYNATKTSDALLSN